MSSGQDERFSTEIRLHSAEAAGHISVRPLRPTTSGIRLRALAVIIVGCNESLSPLLVALCI